MAMVNGPNGVGKSSLFMDSIADCLYETSRDEALGGWLRAGEKKGAMLPRISTPQTIRPMRRETVTLYTLPAHW
jgi:hypothetical protein